MTHFNVLIIEGYVLDTPKMVQDHTCIFDIISTRQYKTKEGENVTRKETFKIMTCDRLARTCNKYLDKGSRVLLTGTMSNGHVLAREVNYLTNKD